MIRGESSSRWGGCQIGTDAWGVRAKWTVNLQSVSERRQAVLSHHQPTGPFRDMPAGRIVRRGGGGPGSGSRRAGRPNCSYCLTLMVVRVEKIGVVGREWAVRYEGRLSQENESVMRPEGACPKAIGAGVRCIARLPYPVKCRKSPVPLITEYTKLEGTWLNAGWTAP